MTHTKSMKTINKLVASLMVAAMFAAAFFVSGHNASAATGDVDLSAGTAAPSADAGDYTYTATQLTGANFTIPKANAFTEGVLDATGGLGWTITITAEDLACTTALTCGTDVIAVANQYVTGATATTGSSNNSATTYGTGISLAVTAVQVYDSAPGTGMGSNSITFNTKLIVPAATRSGSYAGDITVDVVPGT